MLAIQSLVRHGTLSQISYATPSSASRTYGIGTAWVSRKKTCSNPKMIVYSTVVVIDQPQGCTANKKRKKNIDSLLAQFARPNCPSLSMVLHAYFYSPPRPSTQTGWIGGQRLRTAKERRSEFCRFSRRDLYCKVLQEYMVKCLKGARWINYLSWVQKRKA